MKFVILYVFLFIINILTLIYTIYKVFKGKSKIQEKEPFQFLTKKIQDFALGNAFSFYFGYYFYCCLTRTPFYFDTSQHKNIIIKNLPQTLKLIDHNKFTRYSYIDINKLKFINEQGAFWAASFDYMLPTITPVIQYATTHAIQKSNIKTNKYDCVIHYRCSDTPFARHDQYHLLKYDWFTKIFDFIEEKIPITDVVIMNCSTHQSTKDNQQICYKLCQDLGNFLQKKYGISFKILCQTEEIDFVIMYNSKILISGGVSSFSFFAGLASRNLYFTPSFEREIDDNDDRIDDEYMTTDRTLKPCRKNMYVYSLGKKLSLAVRHDQIKDYHNFNQILRQLNN